MRNGARKGAEGVAMVEGGKAERESIAEWRPGASGRFAGELPEARGYNPAIRFKCSLRNKSRPDVTCPSLHDQSRRRPVEGKCISTVRGCFIL